MRVIILFVFLFLFVSCQPEQTPAQVEALPQPPTLADKLSGHFHGSFVHAEENVAKYMNDTGVFRHIEFVEGDTVYIHASDGKAALSYRVQGDTLTISDGSKSYNMLYQPSIYDATFRMLELEGLTLHLSAVE